jgi:hypothetical protein
MRRIPPTVFASCGPAGISPRKAIPKTNEKTTLVLTSAMTFAVDAFGLLSAFTTMKQPNEPITPAISARRTVLVLIEPEPLIGRPDASPVPSDTITEPAHEASISSCGETSISDLLAAYFIGIALNPYDAPASNPYIIHAFISTTSSFLCTNYHSILTAVCQRFII